MQKATEGLKLQKKTMYEIFATSARCPSSSLRQRQAPEVTAHPDADFFFADGIDGRYKTWDLPSTEIAV